MNRFVLALVLASCGVAPPPRDCTTGLTCPSGQVCNTITRRCELSIGGFGAGASVGGGGAGQGGSGAAGGSVGGGTTAGGAAGGSSGTTRVTPWSIIIDVAALTRALPASCYVGGVVPSTFPSGPLTRTIEAVSFESGPDVDMIFENSTGALRLGHAPAYTFPRAIVGGSSTGSTLSFAGAEQVGSLGPSGRLALEMRQLQAQWTFTRNGTQASGTVTVTSQYTCIDNGSQPVERCPTSAPFAPDFASCTVTFPFSAQQLAQVPPWARPASPLLTESFVVLVAEPIFATTPSCYVNQRVPQLRLARTNLSSLYTARRVTLPSGAGLDVNFTRFNIGDAPTITVADPLAARSTPNEFGLTQSITRIGPPGRTSMERRSTEVVLPFAPVNGTARGHIRLLSNYACIDSGSLPSEQCPRPPDAPAADAADCSLGVNYVAHQLP